jgi:hypothetical protein
MITDVPTALSGTDGRVRAALWQGCEDNRESSLHPSDELDRATGERVLRVNRHAAAQTPGTREPLMTQAQCRH